MRLLLLSYAFVVDHVAGHVLADYKQGRSHILHDNNEHFFTQENEFHPTTHHSSNHHGPFVGKYIRLTVQKYFSVTLDSREEGFFLFRILLPKLVRY